MKKPDKFVGVDTINQAARCKSVYPIKKAGVYDDFFKIK